MYRCCPEHPEIREILTFGQPFEREIPDDNCDYCNNEIENLQNPDCEDCENTF